MILPLDDMADDTAWRAAPSGWIPRSKQRSTCVIPMMIGCELVMWERFSASTFWRTVAELEPVAVSAVPTILAAVLHTADAPAGRTSLSVCQLRRRAAPLSRLEAFENRFDIRILEGYGLTEGTCISSVNPYYWAVGR